MISLRRILKDYRDAGALHALVSVQAAVGEGVFATRGGDLVTLLSLAGVPYECLDPGQLDRVARRFESALRIFDERFRVYQYLLKRQATPLPCEHHVHPVVEEAVVNRADYLASKTHYSLETYLAVVYEGWRPGSTLRERLTPRAFTTHHPFSTDKTLHRLTRGLDGARELLTNKVETFVVQLRDLTAVERLDNQRAFTFLRRLLNYKPFKSEAVRLKYHSFVDFQACDSSLECHPDFLRLDDEYVKVLTLKEPPARTFAHLLRALLEIPANFIIASEWKPENPTSVRRLIGSKAAAFSQPQELSGDTLRLLRTVRAARPVDRQQRRGFSRQSRRLPRRNGTPRPHLRSILADRRAPRPRRGGAATFGGPMLQGVRDA